MPVSKAPVHLLSLAAISRKLDIPYSQALAHLRSGVIQATHAGPNNQSLFVEEALPEIRKAVEAAGIAAGKVVS